MLPMGREVWGRFGAPKSYLGLDLKVCDWIRIWVKLESYKEGVMKIHGPVQMY